MTRYFGDPGLQIQLETDQKGFPVRFFAHGQTQAVADIVNAWRVDQGWWRPKATHRTYFKLLTEGGVLCEIYWDDVTQTWYLEREYD